MATLIVTNPQPQLKDRCLCNVHVHTATKILAIVGIILAILSLIFHLVMLVVTANASHPQNNTTTIDIYNLYSSVAYNAGSLAIDLIMLTVSALLLYGVLRKKPDFYWPYLFWTGIFIGLLIIHVIILTIGIVLILFKVIPSSYFHDMSLIVLILIDLFIIQMVVASIHLFFMVPNRSRKLMKTDRFN